MAHLHCCSILKVILSFFLPDSSSYHDVSGLPDPYLEHHQLHLHQDQEDSKSLLQQQQHHQHQQAQQQQAQQQQQMSLNYDESLESGYSTPNSRNRRVIREIIV